MAKPIMLHNFGGLNNTDTPINVGHKSIVKAVNFDSNPDGSLNTRPGRIKVFDGIIDGSWSDGINFLFLSGGILYSVQYNDLIIQLGNVPGKTLVGATGKDGRIYFNTDTYQGVVYSGSVRGLGVDIPTDINVFLGSGGLSAGQYIISATAVADDGRESGVLPTRSVIVGDQSSISITVSGCDYANIYLSECNGDKLYYYAYGTSAFVFNNDDTLKLTDPMRRTAMQDKPPIADLMEYHRGRMYYAKGNTVYYSGVNDYEIIDYDDSGIQLESDITMLKSVETGLFIATANRVHWLIESEGNFSMTDAYRFGCVKGSAVTVDMNRIGDGSGGYGALFVSDDGICLGTADGAVKNLTNRKVRIEEKVSASSNFYGSKFVVI